MVRQLENDEADARQRGDKHAVVVLAKGFPPTTGGVEQYSLQVVRAYLRAGLRPTVFTQTEGSRGWSERTTPDGEFRVWNAGAGGQSAVFLRMIQEVRRFARREPTPLVHATTWRIGLVASVSLRRATKVLTVHGREVINYPKFLAPAIRAVLRESALVLCVSRATRNLLEDAMPGLRADNWVVSYNGLTFPMEKDGLLDSHDDDTIRILSLSRLVPRKNVAASFEALAEADRRGNGNFQMKVAGTGPDRSRLEQAALRLGINDRVDFLGYVDDADVPDLYRWADVFLHPHTHVGEGNDFEGFGIVIADAMAFGCAVVVGDAGGPRELVVQGEDGLLVDGEDQSQVTDAVVELIANPEKARELASRAISSARERFSWDLHVVPALAAFARHGGNR